MRQSALSSAMAVIRGTAAYAALLGGMGCLGWLALQLEAVPVVHWGPWEGSGGRISPVVILDAGHGGHDGGAVANEVTEKVIALELAQRVRSHLEKEGVRVQMTRDSDVFIPLEKRSAIANEADAAAFVSLHLNTSVDATEVSGIETYYSNRKTPFVPHPAAGENPPPVATTTRDDRDEHLARVVQQHACLTSHAENRGIRERGYAVVLHTFCPAVLVECGFLTHKAEALKLNKEDYQDRLAAGIAHGIAEFLKTQSLKPRQEPLTPPKEGSANGPATAVPEP